MNVEKFTLEVRVALTAKNNANDVYIMLDKIVPANMIIDCSLMYNQNNKWMTYTHGQLNSYTHEELRNGGMK